jgi:uncharacterized protein (TIGR02996 family)
MRDADPFLAAIAARPDDDLPRLIFADWLDEHGRGDRAEFIRLQCAAARGEPAALTPDARRRAADLEAAHRDEWLADLSHDVYHAAFRRGFAEHVVLPTAAFMAAGAALRRRTPVRSVALLGAGAALRGLLAGPLLRGLTGLHLNDSLLGDDGVAHLADAPSLRDLETLKLARAAVGDPGAMALARSPHLGRLRTLALRGNAIGDAGAWELARSPTLRRLTALDVAENEIGPSGVAAVRSSYTEADVSGQRDVSGWWRRPALAAAKS